MPQDERRDSMHVLAFAGSLRKSSFNKMLLREAQDLAPLGMGIELFDLAGIPFYNGDVEQQGDPESVTRFKDAAPRQSELCPRSSGTQLRQTRQFRSCVPIFWGMT